MPDDSPTDTPAIQRTLAGYRENLYGGRGPGISEADWLANTSLRQAVAGVPTATSREELHLRTLRARGRRTQAARESRWAAAQFRPAAAAGGYRPARPRSVAGAGRPPRILSVLGWLAALWLRARAHRSGAR